MTCIICQNPILPDPNGWAGGHNAEPITAGICCGECNDTVVTSARLRDAGYSSKQVSEIVTAIAEAK